MGYAYPIGCASIYRRLNLEHRSPREWRVFPRYRLPLAALNSTLNAPLPPLIKGYMRLGCFICGEPA